MAKTRVPARDGRFKVLPEYDRCGWIVGWVVSRNGKDYGMWFQHDRAMAAAQTLAEHYGSPVRKPNSPREEGER